MAEPDFYLDTVRRLCAEGWLRPDADVLVVAGGPLDRDVLAAAGIGSATISNLDDRLRGHELAPYRWSFQDAEALTFDDASFDVCVAHQGLHHCRSPHRALAEMYRVCRRGLVFFEPQETLLTRIGVRVGLGQDYELASVGAHGLLHGGVQNTAVPNFVYRWTEREVSKVLASLDPTGPPRVRCFYDLRVPEHRIGALRSRALRRAAQLAVPVARAVLRIAPRQANAVAVVVDKLDPARDLHPWLVSSPDGPRVDPAWFHARYDTPEPGR
jgi:SAM-dependent methyltransferase